MDTQRIIIYTIGAPTDVVFLIAQAHSTYAARDTRMRSQNTTHPHQYMHTHHRIHTHTMHTLFAERCALTEYIHTHTRIHNAYTMHTQCIHCSSQRTVQGSPSVLRFLQHRQIPEATLRAGRSGREGTHVAGKNWGQPVRAHQVKVSLSHFGLGVLRCVEVMFTLTTLSTVTLTHRSTPKSKM